jgi:hypothetical protein
MQAVLAQCKGEAALSTVNAPAAEDPYHQKETALVNGCMARNG